MSGLKEDCEFQTSLDYIVRPCLKTKTKIDPTLSTKISVQKSHSVTIGTFFFFGNIGVWTQGLTLVSQLFLPLEQRPPPAIYVFSYFWNRVLHLHTHIHTHIMPELWYSYWTLLSCWDYRFVSSLCLTLSPFKNTNFVWFISGMLQSLDI
jgi:hypothetical protein